MNTFEQVVVVCLIIIILILLYTSFEVKRGVDEIQKGVREIQKGVDVTGERVENAWGVAKSVSDVVDRVKGVFGRE